MAVYSKADHVQLVRDIIEEPTARIFTDTQLNYMIDVGTQLASSLSLFNQTDEDETCVGDQYVYSPSANFVRVEAVAYIDVGTPDIEYGLQRIKPEAFGNVVAITASRPLYYWVHWADAVAKIYITPAPTTAMATAVDQIRIKGVSLSTSYGPPNEEFAQFLVHYYVMAAVYATLGKHSLSAYNMNLFINECNKTLVDVYGDVGRVDSHDMTKIPDISVPINTQAGGN